MIIVLGALVSALLYALNRRRGPGPGPGPDQNQSKHATPSGKGAASAATPTADGTETLIGCDTVEVEDVWVKGFPKLLTEAAFRLVDVNEDGDLDVLLGFATGKDGVGWLVGWWGLCRSGSCCCCCCFCVRLVAAVVNAVAITLLQRSLVQLLLLLLFLCLSSL